MKRTFAIGFACIAIFLSFGQFTGKSPANVWVDSVYKSLSKEEKIAQLMVIRAHSNMGPEHVQQVTNLIQQYNVGALCFFQGGPVRQANLTNYYQAIAKTPLLIIDDFGLRPLTHDMRLTLLQILEDRFAKGATVVTSQLPINKWYEYINEPTLADAICDRLTANANKIELKGASLRQKKNN